MRSLRSFEVEPWLRSAGQQVWTRLRRGLGTREAELQAALQHEVEQLRDARSNVQRATQLARVLDAVFALAEAHELSEAQLSALREPRPAPRVAPVVELARKLERSAVQVIDQVLGVEPAPVAGGELRTQLRVRTDGLGLEALVSWLAAGPAHKRAPRSEQRTAPSLPPSAASGRSALRKHLPLPAAALAERVTELAAELRLPLPRSGPASRRADLAADVRVERAGVDAARASLLWSPSELSLRLRVTHQTALEALQWLSAHNRAELTLWLLSRGTRLVLRKWVAPQLARGQVGPQLLLRVALGAAPRLRGK